jgi:hypothetical protein
MNPRGWLVVGALMALPAWSQQPSLDLNSDTVKKIIRDTAATQYAAPQLAEMKPAGHQPMTEKVVRYVPPERSPERSPAKLNLPALPAPLQSSFMSALIDTLVSEALGTDSYDNPVETNTVSWLTCQAAIDLKRETLGQKSCKE